MEKNFHAKQPKTFKTRMQSIQDHRQGVAEKFNSESKEKSYRLEKETISRNKQGIASKRLLFSSVIDNRKSGFSLENAS